MRNTLIILLIIVLNSCTSIKYIKKPINKSPSVGLSADKIRIIVASDRKLFEKEYAFNLCLDELNAFLDASDNVKVLENISFNEKVDSILLTEIKKEYNIDGLLLLTDLYLGETTSNEIIEGFSSGRLGSKKNIYIYNQSWLNLRTTWKYFDLNTGNTYNFFAERDKDFTIRYHIEDTVTYEETRFKAIDELLIENGQQSSKVFYGL